MLEEYLPSRSPVNVERAVRQGKPDFKGTNGWLEKWKKCYNIRRVVVCGESGDVRGDTIDSWRERLPKF